MTWIRDVVLILILAVVAWQAIVPRNPTISVEAVNGIQRVTNQLQRVADNMENNSNATAALTQTLARQLEQRTEEDNSGYAKLLEKYGVDVNLSSIPDPSGLQRQPQTVRDQLNPPGSSGASKDQHVPEAGPGGSGKADPSAPSTQKSPRGDATQSVK